MAGDLSSRQFLPLPWASFQSHAEFVEYRRQNGDLLTTRWLHERSLATSRREVEVEGTCGICLRPATFTAATVGGEVVETGTMPNWREGLSCSCESRLIGRERAVLQCLLGNIGLQPWYRVLVLGQATPLTRIIEAFTARTTLHTLDGGPSSQRRPTTFPGNHHLVVALDVLHAAPFPADLLSGIVKSLLPGGQMVFSLPFHSDEPHSALSSWDAAGSGGQHKIGWDILQSARDAGFATAAAHLYWSEEFGYLGSPNFIFSAAR